MAAGTSERRPCAPSISNTACGARMLTAASTGPNNELNSKQPSCQGMQRPAWVNGAESAGRPQQRLTVICWKAHATTPQRELADNIAAWQGLRPPLEL
ncbi:Hypothetical predicted protein [Pelobates cultripes]|uniref:Uncharacterized protein n=1 Tax=Pelobates cultripes TaxID=61616 RepID=A0AAD1TCX3_PELCU|nr:Hypothetical predicted protein [Pelobates cultripes]